MNEIAKKNIGLSSRYINALFDLCVEQKKLKKVLSDFNNFLKLVKNNNSLQIVLKSPTIGKNVLSKVLIDVLKKNNSDDLTIKFCGTLCKNGRVFYLTKFMEEFIKEVSRLRGELAVEVYSAYKLNKSEEDKLKKIILNKTNRKTISLFTYVDDTLIGGLIVKYGSKMIDSSIKTKLNNLELAMKGEN